jgi:hypothetical protein
MLVPYSVSPSEFVGLSMQLWRGLRRKGTQGRIVRGPDAGQRRNGKEMRRRKRMQMRRVDQ